MIHHWVSEIRMDLWFLHVFPLLEIFSDDASISTQDQMLCSCPVPMFSTCLICSKTDSVSLILFTYFNECYEYI